MFSVALYLDRRTPRPDGTCQVKVGIHSHSSSAYLPTGVWVEPRRWDARRRRLTSPSPAQAALEGMVARVSSLLLRMRSEGRLSGLSATEAKNLVRREIDPEPGRGTLPYYFRRYISGCRAERTREMYQLTLKKLTAYDPSLPSRPLRELTRAWVRGFDRWMLPARPNTRAIELRNLRAVVNMAIDEGEDCPYPFRKMPMPQERAAHRALPIEELRRLMAMETADPNLSLALDVFRLTFLLIGINISDLWGLETMRDGRVEYVRRKTGRRYSVRVEPEAMGIIRRHGGKARLLDFADRYKSPHTMTVAVDKFLKRLSPGVTTYSARHSWATVAASLGIPADTISRALGHSFSTGAAVTLIYIDYDMRLVDEANRRVIDWVMRGIKRGPDPEGSGPVPSLRED